MADIFNFIDYIKITNEATNTSKKSLSLKKIESKKKGGEDGGIYVHFTLNID